MYLVYTDQARAAADLALVNYAFVAGRDPSTLTSKWAELTECADGWAFEKPLCPELCTLLGEHTEAESITAI